MRNFPVKVWVAAIGTFVLGLSPLVRAGDFDMDVESRWWLEGGIGGGQVDTRAPGLPGRHGTAILSLGAGFRATPQASIGFEYATSASLFGCQRWDCEGHSWEFMPAFNRATLFGEIRFLDGRMRLRYGVGDLSYCYAGGAGLNLWYLALDGDDDDFVNLYTCDAVHGFVKSASLGYFWRMDGGSGVPATAGLKLGVEDANMHGAARVGLPPFHYRAVTLTLQLSFY